jgi:hypothetical protein
MQKPFETETLGGGCLLVEDACSWRATTKSLSFERLLHHHLSALTPSLLCRLPDAGPGRRNHVDSLEISYIIQRDP